MNLVFRSTAAACVAAAVLFVASAPNIAQEDDEMITRTYHVRGIVQDENRRDTRTNAIGDVLAPDRWLGGEDERPFETWSLRDSGDEARCWSQVYQLWDQIEEYTNCEYDSISFPSATSFTVTASAESHGRIGFMVDALRNIADARVNLAIYRLPGAAPAAPLVTPAEMKATLAGARVVGTVAGGLGDPLILQHTAHKSYVAGYDINLATEVQATEPVVATLNTGEEFAFGVLSMPDGNLWLSGWHVAMTENAMRKRLTSGGHVELPDVGYRYSPVSAEVANGGGVVIDAGEGNRYLVVARCDRLVNDRQFKCDDGRVISLLNVGGALRGYGVSQSWIMTPNSSQMLGEQMLPQVFIEPIEDGPYNDAAIFLVEMLEDGEVYMNVFGPYLLMAQDEDNADAHAAVLATINSKRAHAETISLRISAFEVKGDAAIPAGVMLGNPDANDIAELKALNGKPVFSRTVASRTSEAYDMMDLRLMTHVRDYETHTATGVAAEQPVIGTIVLGTQMRWIARPTPEGLMRVEVRTGTTVGPTELEAVRQGNTWEIERSRSALTQTRMSNDLAAGQGAASISPAAGPNGELLVLIVERLK